MNREATIPQSLLTISKLANPKLFPWPGLAWPCLSCGKHNKGYELCFLFHFSCPLTHPGLILVA